MNDEDKQALLCHGLEDERVRLSVITSMDAMDQLEEVALANRDLLLYSPRMVNDREQLNRYLRIALEEMASGSRIIFSVFDKRNQSFAGSTSYLNISAFHLRVEIGATWLGVNFQRTGLNQHMKYLMMLFAFEQAHMERLEWKTDRRNEQSRRAISKLGAVYEGTLRSHTLMHDGTRRDTVYYSMLKEEWPAAKSMIQDRINRNM